MYFNYFEKKKDIKVIENIIKKIEKKCFIFYYILNNLNWY
jgi:hypothetical protein